MHACNDFKPDEIQKMDSDNSYLICINGTFLKNRFVDAKTIVYVGGCFTANLSASWGARVVLGYGGLSDTKQQFEDADTFWRRMAGTKDGGTKRPVGKAVEGTSLADPTGAGNTVLAPIVKEHGGSPVVFDCKMDTSINPKEVVTAPPDEAILANWMWVGDDRISFDVVPLKPLVHFTVHADRAISGNNGAKLDGNQNPQGTNGVGPNGDDYVYEQTHAHEILGDVNGDRIVDIVDGVIIGVAFGSRPGDPNWNPIADIAPECAPDDYINIQDIVLWGLHFGETA